MYSRFETHLPEFGTSLVFFVVRHLKLYSGYQIPDGEGRGYLEFYIDKQKYIISVKHNRFRALNNTKEADRSKIILHDFEQERLEQVALSRNAIPMVAIVFDDDNFSQDRFLDNINYNMFESCFNPYEVTRETQMFNNCGTVDIYMMTLSNLKSFITDDYLKDAIQKSFRGIAINNKRNLLSHHSKIDHTRLDISKINTNLTI